MPVVGKFLFIKIIHSWNYILQSGLVIIIFSLWHIKVVYSLWFGNLLRKSFYSFHTLFDKCHCLRE